MATKLLTENQKHFVEEYAIDRNAVQAYRRAYGPGVTYGSAATLAGRLLKKVEVQNALRAARRDSLRRAGSMPIESSGNSP